MGDLVYQIGKQESDVLFLAVLCLLLITVVQCAERLIGMHDLTNRKGLS